MPISEAKIREMRENSARKYAEQLRREEKQAENYANERKKNMAKMMNAKERNAAVFKAAQEGVSVREISEKFGLTEARVKKIIASETGVINAAEMSAQERADLTAQVEADAGLFFDGSGESASDIANEEDEREERRTGPYEYGPATDEPGCTDLTDIYNIAREILGAMRLAHIPDGTDVSVRISGGVCSVDVANSDMTLSSTMKWR